MAERARSNCLCVFLGYFLKYEEKIHMGDRREEERPPLAKEPVLSVHIEQGRL